MDFSGNKGNAEDADIKISPLPNTFITINPKDSTNIFPNKNTAKTHFLNFSSLAFATPIIPNPLYHLFIVSSSLNIYYTYA